MQLQCCLRNNFSKLYLPCETFGPLSLSIYGPHIWSSFVLTWYGHRPLYGSGLTICWSRICTSLSCGSHGFHMVLTWLSQGVKWSSYLISTLTAFVIIISNHHLAGTQTTARCQATVLLLLGLTGFAQDLPVKSMAMHPGPYSLTQKTNPVVIFILIFVPIQIPILVMTDHIDRYTSENMETTRRPVKKYGYHPIKSNPTIYRQVLPH